MTGVAQSTPAWAAEKVALLRDRLLGTPSHRGFPSVAPAGLGADPVLPNEATLAQLAGIETLVALRDAAALPTAGAADAVVELRGAFDAPLSEALAGARPDLTCHAIDDVGELAAFAPGSVGVVSGVLALGAREPAAVRELIAALHAQAVPAVHFLDRLGPGTDGALFEVLREHYWPRLIHVLPFGVADEPVDLPILPATLVQRMRRPSSVGPSVLRWRGDENAPRHVLGWRRSTR